MTAEKGVADAIELARASGRRLRMVAKADHPQEQASFADVVRPAIDEGVVEFLGELGPPGPRHRPGRRAGPGRDPPAVERFSPERMVDEYEATYRTLVGEEGAAGEGVR